MPGLNKFSGEKSVNIFPRAKSGPWSHCISAHRDIRDGYLVPCSFVLQ